MTHPGEGKMAGERRLESQMWNGNGINVPSPCAAGKGVRWWCPVGEGKKEFKK